MPKRIFGLDVATDGDQIKHAQSGLVVARQLTFDDIKVIKYKCMP